MAGGRAGGVVWSLGHGCRHARPGWQLLCPAACSELPLASTRPNIIPFSLTRRRRGPAYTVNLEVQYKSKIEAGRTILCTTEVESLEGRKLWMKVGRQGGGGRRGGGDNVGVMVAAG